jgi:hypothetical protein
MSGIVALDFSGVQSLGLVRPPGRVDILDPEIELEICAGADFGRRLGELKARAVTQFDDREFVLAHIRNRAHGLEKIDGPGKIGYRQSQMGQGNG